MSDRWKDVKEIRFYDNVSVFPLLAVYQGGWPPERRWIVSKSGPEGGVLNPETGEWFNPTTHVLPRNMTFDDPLKAVEAIPATPPTQTEPLCP